MISIKKILVPTDFSEHSKLALPYAIDFARTFGAELHILHAFDENALDPFYFSTGGSAAEYYQKLQNSFKAMVDDMFTDVDTEGINIIRVLSNGTPFVEIVRYGKKEDMDMIIISTHGRSGLSHMLLGSTTEKVIRKAHCPVLTVRKPGFSFEMP